MEDEDEAARGGLDRRMFVENDEEDAVAAESTEMGTAVEGFPGVVTFVERGDELADALPLMTESGMETPSALTKMLIRALFSTSTKRK
jgi:hypothetical protein